MYTIITVCRDIVSDEWGNDMVGFPYLDSGKLVLYKTKEAAFKAAENEAEDELQTLEDGDFNIPEDDDYQSGSEVKVCGYFDDTYCVTRRVIKEIGE